jgi:hypothetical protein
LFCACIAVSVMIAYELMRVEDFVQRRP